MRKRTMLLILILWTSGVMSSAAQEIHNLGLHGTFVMAAIGKDGIILAADSRLSFYNKKSQNRTTLAYYDGVKKIYPIRGSAMAFAGTATVGTTFLGRVIEYFEEWLPKGQIPVDSLGYYFFRFCKEKVSPVNRAEILGNKIFIVGYKGAKPLICVFQLGYNNDNFICGMVAAQSSPSVVLHSIKETMTCKQLSQHAISAIAEKEKADLSIGGPVQIYKITPSGGEFMFNNLGKFRWNTVQEFHRDYFSGKAKVHFVKPQYKTEVEQMFKEK